MISVPDIHHRHSIRLKGYDYGQAGAYFITICAWQRQCLFGEVVNDKMVLSNKGRVVAEEWENTETIRKNIILDEFVVMPNHFHGIMFFSDHVGAMHQQRATHRVAPTGPRSGSIGAIMAQFKSIVTKHITTCHNSRACSVWQRNYYERVIRNENELSRAREYIINNPLKWAMDNENPLNCEIGAE